ncbi:MAG: carboxymethylenebutenolidase [Magnetovibrio sp.]|nr:carboxymethylenebutenolidase [Magnetovibrio sp.]
MGQDIILTAPDGHSFGAYRCEPEGSPLGSVVVVQEIFGVNNHIRDVAERFASIGWLTVAPSLYDRWQPAFTGGYTPDDVASGRDLKEKANAEAEKVILDLGTARSAVAEAGKVGIVGYCWGGYATWLAASRLNFQAAVAYYGGGIINSNDEQPKCPMILHFGALDTSIPMTEVNAIRNAHPDVSVHVFDADHGFNCDQRSQYDPRAASVAAMLTERLFSENLRN